MAATIEQGRVEIARLLREVAAEQGVELEDVQWFKSEPPPSGIPWDPSLDYSEVHSLTAKDMSGGIEEKDFASEELAGCMDDNQMIVRVRAKVESIVIKLMKHQA